MSKDANWFKHDYHSRNDDKVRCLIMQYGLVGFGVFWLIVESLHENSQSRIDKKEIKILAMANNISYQELEKILFTMVEIELLQEDEKSYFSLNVIERKSKFLEKSKKLSDSGKAGAEKRWGNNSHAIEPYSHPIAKDSHPIGSDSREEKRREEKKRLEENKKELKEKYSKEFEIFQVCYNLYSNRDRLRSVETEFRLFTKHKDFKEVLTYLETAIQRQNQLYKQKGTETQYQRKFANWLADREFEAFKNKQQTEAERWAEHVKRALAYEATK